MSTKWIDNALRRQKQDAPNGKENGAFVPAEKIQANAEVQGLTKSRVDLQSVEDIYRAAGIVNPRLGYSIRKVVDRPENTYTLV